MNDLTWYAFFALLTFLYCLTVGRVRLPNTKPHVLAFAIAICSLFWPFAWAYVIVYVWRKTHERTRN